MNTKTITITDLAGVQPGDMVTAEYIPMSHERGARIVGEASQDASGDLIVGGHYLRHLRFVSATREVPAWEPPAELVAAFADDLARLWGAPDAGAVYVKDARKLLGWMHDNGWLKEDDPTGTPADPAPVDPVLDENDKRDRIDSEGDRWRWQKYDEVWKLNAHNVRGNLAALDRHYGPLRFTNKDDK